MTSSVNAEALIDAAEPPAKAKTTSKRGILIGVVATVATASAAWALAHRGIESTDDATIDAEIVALASRTGGVVVKVNFEDNERVEAGRVLAELDAEPAKARLAQAEANLEAARATLDAAEADARVSKTTATASSKAATASLSAASAGASASRDQINEARARVRAAESSLAQSKTDLDRVQQLVQNGAISQAQLDQARTTNETAKANLAQAQANLSVLEASATQAQSRVGEASAKVDQTRDVDAVVAQNFARIRNAKAKVAELEASRDLAALDVSYTRIVAPQNGVVSKKNINVGQTISIGAPVAQLLPAKPVWVTANFKETQIGNMRIGQPVEMSVDAFSSLKLHGTVESFAGATGSRFALLPPDNATGNFTKVVQRVPVRIKVESAPENLRPGMSVVLSVNTRK